MTPDYKSNLEFATPVKEKRLADYSLGSGKKFKNNGNFSHLAPKTPESLKSLMKRKLSPPPLREKRVSHKREQFLFSNQINYDGGVFDKYLLQTPERGHPGMDIDLFGKEFLQTPERMQALIDNDATPPPLRRRLRIKPRNDCNSSYFLPKAWIKPLPTQLDHYFSL